MAAARSRGDVTRAPTAASSSLATSQVWAIVGIYASPGYRTPPLVQGILGNCCVLFVVPFSKRLLGDQKAYLSRVPLTAATFYCSIGLPALGDAYGTQTSTGDIGVGCTPTVALAAWCSAGGFVVSYIGGAALNRERCVASSNGVVGGVRSPDETRVRKICPANDAEVVVR